MGDILNQECQDAFRKHLRNNATEPERVLWMHLQGKQLGFKFRRQHGVDKYILDFYCPKLSLAVELDGDSHFDSAESIEKDKERDKFLRRLGIRVLRFTNLEAKENIEGVVSRIMDECRTPPSLPVSELF